MANEKNERVIYIMTGVAWVLTIVAWILIGIISFNNWTGVTDDFWSVIAWLIVWHTVTAIFKFIIFAVVAVILSKLKVNI